MTAPDSRSERLWNDFHERLRSFVRGRVRDDSLAEDIVQDIFLKVHTRASQLRDEEKIAPWLYQIARNAVIDHVRKPRIEGREDETVAAAEPDGPLFAEQRLAESLGSMIDELPEPYREAVRLTEIDGLTQAEMAARVGISVSGAKSRVQRGREKLRELILDCCHVELDHRGAVVDYWERPVCCDRRSK